MSATETGTYRSVLAIRDFRMLVVGSGASQLGDWLYNVALLVYVFDRTHSAAWVAVATMVRLLPFVLFGAVGGVLADRYERTKVMVVSSIAQGVVMATITVAVAQHATALVVIALAGASSSAAVAVRPAALAMLPPIVTETSLAPANALLHTVQDIGVVAGPAVGAAILALASPATAFGVNAATFAVAALSFRLIRQRSTGAGESTPSPLTQFTDGVRAMRHTPYVPVISILIGVVNFTYGAQTVQLVIYVQERLGLSSDGYGYLLAATGAGAVLGAVVSGRLAARRRIAAPLVAAVLFFVVSELLFAGIDVTGLAIAIGVLAGLGMVVADVVSETAISRTVSNEIMGRIFGAYDAITVGAIVVGALAAAPLVRWSGLRLSMVILGVVAVVVTVAALPVLVGLDRVSTAALRVLAPRVAAISGLPLFHAVPRAALERLATASEELDVGPGTVVIAEGDPADAFYVCTDGSLDVSSTGELGGEAQHLRVLAPGDYFGEIGLIEEMPRTATVRALTECTVLRIPGDVFLDALTTSPAGLSTMRDGVIRGLGRTHPALRPRRVEELLAAARVDPGSPGARCAVRDSNPEPAD